MIEEAVAGFHAAGRRRRRAPDWPTPRARLSRGRRVAPDAADQTAIARLGAAIPSSS